MDIREELREIIESSKGSRIYRTFVQTEKDIDDNNEKYGLSKQIEEIKLKGPIGEINKQVNGILEGLLSN